MLETVIANLEKRRWTETKRVLTAMANESLDEAKKRPTDGAKGVPALLKWAFNQNAFLSFLANEKARLVDADLEKQLQTGLVVLGEARGQEIYRSAREASRAVVSILANDALTAGEQSLKIPPEPLSSLLPVAPGGRILSPVEQRLSGHWIWSYRSQSVGSSARVELHMILLGDGHVARTSKSIAFSSLKDSSGNWMGSIDAVSGLSGGERGKWKADGTFLTLEMDDGSEYEYRYSQSGPKMNTTNTTGWEQRYWTRSSG